MFKYTGSRTCTSMMSNDNNSTTLMPTTPGTGTTTLLLGRKPSSRWSGVNEKQQQQKKKKRRFFGSPPATLTGRCRPPPLEAEMPIPKSATLGAMPRSRSCQSTARLRPTAGSVEPPIDRRWWLEPTDIPAIDGATGAMSDRAEMLAMGKQKQQRQQPKSTAVGKPTKQQQLEAGDGKGGALDGGGAEASLHHALLRLPRAMMLSNGASPAATSTTCCSDSPCSSSSLAIPGLLLLEDEPLTINGHLHHSSNQQRNREEQQNGHAAEKWPSAEELARCLSRLFPSVDWSAPQREVLAQLLCLRAFISPAEILHKLLQHTMFVQHARAANFSKGSQRQLFDHVLAFCALWVRSVPFDFREQPMRDRLLAVLCLSGAQKDEAAQRSCDELLAELRLALGRLERYEQAIRSLEPQLERQWERRWETPSGLMALGKSALAVAQQLAHIELERLSMVGLDELVQCVSAVHSLDQLGQRAPPGCVRHYVQWFNQLSQLTASELLRHQHKRHRAKCAEFLVEVARECLALGNFNSLAAIVAGLSAQPVARLRRTWARVDKGRLEVLQRQLDPSGNFATYRATLKAAIWAAAASGDRLHHRHSASAAASSASPSSPPPPNGNAKTPTTAATTATGSSASPAAAVGSHHQQQQQQVVVIIPFFGLLLKDAFFLHRQCRLPGPAGHLNRLAFDEFGELVTRLERWQRAHCPFTRVGSVLQHLLLSPLLPERSMFLLSYGYEPPENSADREQLRRLSQANLQESAAAAATPIEPTAKGSGSSKSNGGTNGQACKAANRSAS